MTKLKIERIAFKRVGKHHGSAIIHQAPLSPKGSLGLFRGYINILRELFTILSEWCSPTTMWMGLVLPGIFINLLSLAFPLILLQVYDRVIPQQSIYTLTFLIVGGIIVTGIAMVLSILRSVSINWTSARFEYFTHLRVFQ
ncbi:hypothetical protein [Coxiella burnetii]|uniref:hypothetical protein n=1 Tax=Coxiella burnetii TaxID=777 RepID=UPI001E486419|nr:hypothetical protein [Coxiella burnetii]